MSTAIPTDPAPTLEEIWRLFRETDRKFEETDRRMKETDKQIKAMSKKIGELGNRLGEFVEEMIKPSVVRLFQERGIDIHSVMRNVETHNPQLNLAMQIDLFVVNNGSCVLVEVKSNLSQDDIEEHLERMEKFKTLFPIYRDYKVLGAVAGMVIPENVARYAYKKGFFVIAQKGDSVVILNDNKFQPIAW